MINKILTPLGKNLSMSVTLQGHTESVGSDEYNMDLSLRRAKAIKAILWEKGFHHTDLQPRGLGLQKRFPTIALKVPVL